MPTSQCSGAPGAPSPIVLQAGAIRRRIAASDSVAALVASLAYGEPREPLAWAWPIPTALAAGVRQ